MLGYKALQLFNLLLYFRTALVFAPQISKFSENQHKTYARPAKHYAGRRMLIFIFHLYISILFGVVVGCILTYSKAFTVENSSYESELLSTYQKIRDNYYDEVSEKELLNAAIDGIMRMVMEISLRMHTM